MEYPQRAVKPSIAYMGDTRTQSVLDEGSQDTNISAFSGLLTLKVRHLTLFCADCNITPVASQQGLF
jgi:hypothetical protein